MTPRSAAERGPGTAAGRVLLTSFEFDDGTWHETRFDLREAILAIEAEAARREAGLREALEEAISLPLHGGYQQQQARWRRLLHDNAGVTAPAEGTP